MGVWEWGRDCGVTQDKATCIKLFEYLSPFGPPVVCKKVNIVANTKCLHSNAQYIINRPRTNLKFTERHRLIWGTYYWDLLDKHVHQPDSVNIFKKRIKDCIVHYPCAALPLPSSGVGFYIRAQSGSGGKGETRAGITMGGVLLHGSEWMSEQMCEWMRNEWGGRGTRGYDRNPVLIH